MTSLTKIHAGPDGTQIKCGHVRFAAVCGEGSTRRFHIVGALGESFGREVFGPCRLDGSLERNELRFRCLQSNGQVFAVGRFGSFNCRFPIPEKNLDRDSIYFPVVHSGSKITAGTTQTTIGMFGPAHGALTSGTSHDSFQQTFNVPGVVRGGMLDLCGFPQFPVNEGTVRGRVMPGTHCELPKINPVANDFRGGRRGDVITENPADLPPRPASGTAPERRPDLRGVVTELESSVLTFHISGRDFRHRPNAVLNGTRFRVGYRLSVSFTLHRGQGQENVTRHSAFRGCRVHVFTNRDHLTPGLLYALYDPQGRGHFHAGQTVDLADNNPVKLATFDRFDGTFKDRSFHFPAGHVKLRGQNSQRPATHGSERMTAFLLKFGTNQVLPASDPRHSRILKESHGGYNTTSTTVERKVSLGRVFGFTARFVTTNRGETAPRTGAI